ncbi:MAG: signal peptidase I [Solobacterium sp.]|nr:signal peptidase I [Solobacterium sp.]
MENKNKELWKAIGNEALDWAKTLAVSFLIVTITVNFFIRTIQVDGSSMYPTLESDEFGLSNVLSVRLDQIERFDIAVIYMEKDNKYLVKRVIGLPGETVSYRSGILYINGEEVRERFLDTDYCRNYNGVFMGDIDEITLGENEYYCLGDNRPNSKDSRYYGPFQKKQIKCVGALILYPFDRFGLRSW